TASPLAPGRAQWLALPLVIAIEQLDRNPLRSADEADAQARPHGGGLLGELTALGLELGGNRVDAVHPQTEMLEPAIGDFGGWIMPIAFGDVDIDAADLEVDARLAVDC